MDFCLDLSVGSLWKFDLFIEIFAFILHTLFSWFCYQLTQVAVFFFFEWKFVVRKQGKKSVAYEYI